MDLKNLLRMIIATPSLHVRWLNTLSYLENCGARKIAATEHPTIVKEEMLKHAAEEFRHAHDLKRQLLKITPTPPDTYRDLLGGILSLRYLDRLEASIVRHISQKNLPKEAIYLLVTYAIEMRASLLYPLYHTLLKEAGSKVNVRSIFLEEEEHLADISAKLLLLPENEELATLACHLEGVQFDRLQHCLCNEICRL